MKYLYIIIASLCFYLEVFADVEEVVDTMWLPTFWTKWANHSQAFISKSIAEGIKYVWLLAVIALTYWWIRYIISLGDDNKIKTAKNIITYSIIWVVASMLAFAVIELVNNVSLW